MTRSFKHFILLLLLAGCSEERPAILDVRSVMNKTPHQVEEVLGPPDSTYQMSLISGRTMLVQVYQKDSHNIEIQYPSGNATDILINNPEPYPYSKDFLATLGLDVENPDELEKGYMKWKQLKGIHVVNMYTVYENELGEIEKFKVFIKAAKQ